MNKGFGSSRSAPAPDSMVESLRKRLGDFPRVRLARLPTAVVELARLADNVGAAAIHYKADETTGLGFGGNKVRQLEFLLGDALERGADTILITGARQSNFVCLAAAAAARLGLACCVQLEDRVPREDPTYQHSGNVLLDRLFGAEVLTYPHGEDEAGADAQLHRRAETLRQQGRNPYVIPLAPGPPPIGALGYVNAAVELKGEGALGEVNEIVVGSGSGHTHAGLLVGLRAIGERAVVRGVCVRRGADRQRPRILERCREVEALLGSGRVVDERDVCVDDSVLAPGYGQLNAAVREAMSLAARCEGLVLDPVYTGRVMAGLVNAAAQSERPKRYLFIHTGGVPALFAYGDEVLE